MRHNFNIFEFWGCTQSLSNLQSRGQTEVKSQLCNINPFFYYYEIFMGTIGAMK